MTHAEHTGLNHEQLRRHHHVIQQMSLCALASDLHSLHKRQRGGTCGNKATAHLSTQRAVAISVCFLGDLDVYLIHCRILKSFRERRVVLGAPRRKRISGSVASSAAIRQTTSNLSASKFTFLVVAFLLAPEILKTFTTFSIIDHIVSQKLFLV